MMKKTIVAPFLAVLAIATLAGCNSIDGTLTVIQPFTHSNPSGKVKTVDFKPGRYEATLDFPSEKQVNLIVKGVSDKEKQTKIAFKIPKGHQIPGWEGDFSLSPSESGQPYDLAGNVHTNVVDTELTRRVESCTYEEREWVCRGWDHGHQDCYWDVVTRYGRHNVEFFYRNTTKNVTFSMKAPSTTDALATFTGSTTDTDKIYTYQSRCW